MARARSPEKQRELDQIVQILCVLTDFKRGVFGAELGEKGEQLGQMFVDAIEKAYASGSLAGLRMAYNDLVEMAQSYSPAQLRQLDGRLRSEAGTSLNDLFAKRNARVKAIRERGRITSDEQYYLVREFFEFMWDDPARRDEASELQELMFKHEQRKGRAAARRFGDQ
jgi:hypothetical protein